MYAACFMHASCNVDFAEDASPKLIAEHVSAELPYTRMQVLETVDLQ